MPELQVAATATGNGTPLNVLGKSTVAFQLSGTFVATVTFEGTVDYHTWIAITARDVASGGTATTATTTGIYVADCAGLLFVRARVSAYTSGSVTVVAEATMGESDGATTGSEVHLGQVGGEAVVAAASQFTRPADTTAYAAGDLVANSTTAGSVTPLSFTVSRVAGGTGLIRRARLKKSGTSTTNAQFRLHLYASAPTIANGDNGAWSTSGAATYLGAMDVTVDKAFTDGAAGQGVPSMGSEIVFDLSSGTTLRGLLEARAAYTPGNAETFDCSLEVLQN